MKTDCLIIGGGISGLTCRAELAKLGFASFLVEKRPFFGGHAVHFTCKATDRCRNCGACLIVEAVRDIESARDGSWILSSRVEHIQFNEGIYESVIFQEPARIDPETCDACGECIKACPVPNAIDEIPGRGRPYIRNELCLRSLNQACSVCAEICHRSAIDLSNSGKEIRISSPAVIVAGGFEPFDPSGKPHYGYRRVPGVVTALELERLLRRDQLNVSRGNAANPSIAFIQCVGSRDPRIGRNYCSQACCAYAIRLACLLKFKTPSLELTMFYMDIQSFERDFQQHLADAFSQISFVRSMPAEIRKGEDGRPQVLYHGPADERYLQSFDLVVLAVGMSPSETMPALDFLNRTEEGFLGDSGIKCTSSAPGIFVAGAAQGPKSIKDSVHHALRAAWRTASYLMECDRGADS